MKHKTENIRLTLILFLAVASLFYACQKETEMDEFPGSLIVELRESFVNNERIPALYVVTQEEFPCANFYIDYTYSHADGQRKIRFNRLVLPGNCLTAFGRAKAFIELESMSEGIHPVYFEVNKNELLTEFHLDEDSLTVDMPLGKIGSILFAENIMYRLPDKYVWGYIHAKAPQSHNDYSQFFQQLLEAGAEEKHLEPGNYGFFRIDEESFVLFVHEMHFHPETPFVLLFDNDFEILTDIAYGLNDDFVIVLYSAKGDVYHNQQP